MAVRPTASGRVLRALLVGFAIVLAVRSAFAQPAAGSTPVVAGEPTPLAAGAAGSTPVVIGTPAEEPTPGPAALVIPPGEETLLAEMLGTGQELAGGCKFTDGNVQSAVVQATYVCADGKVVLDLRHPDTAPADAVRTGKFALTIVSGTAPAGFMDALVARIRAREGEFGWKEVGRDGGIRMGRTLPIGIGVVVLALVVWAVRRARRRAPADT